MYTDTASTGLSGFKLKKLVKAPLKIVKKAAVPIVATVANAYAPGSGTAVMKVAGQAQQAKAARRALAPPRAAAPAPVAPPSQSAFFAPSGGAAPLPVFDRGAADYPAAPGPGLPSWALPAALGVGGLVLVSVLARGRA